MSEHYSISPLGTAALAILNDPTTTTIAAFQKAVAQPLEQQLADARAQVATLREALEGVVFHYGDGGAHIGRGARMRDAIAQCRAALDAQKAGVE